MSNKINKLLWCDKYCKSNQFILMDIFYFKIWSLKLILIRIVKIPIDVLIAETKYHFSENYLN